MGLKIPTTVIIYLLIIKETEMASSWCYSNEWIQPTEAQETLCIFHLECEPET